MQLGGLYDNTHTHTHTLNLPLTVSEDSKSSDDEFGFSDEEDDGLEATASVDHYESLVSLTLSTQHTSTSTHLPLTYPPAHMHTHT